MLNPFKRNKKQEENETTEDEVDEVLIQQQYDKALKKVDRKIRRRKITLYVVIGICLIGAIRSCAPTTNTQQYKEVEAQTFVKNYASNYYAFPSDEKKKETLDSFTLQSNDWYVKYASSIEYAYLKSMDVYKVIPEDETLDITGYYLYGDLVSKEKEEKEISERIYFKIIVAKQDSAYLVVRPIESTQVDIASIEDETIKKELEVKTDSGSQSVTPEAQKDLEDTLTLFLKTYNDDIVQARLLCANKTVIDELDPNFKLELSNISNATFSEEKTYVVLDTNATYKNIYTKTNKYYIVIDNKTNKIETMEEI